MATLNAQNILRSGLAPAFVAANAGGDQFVPDREAYLHVKNGGAGAITVTVAAGQVPAPNLTTTMQGVSVPAGGERLLGPFPYQIFADANGFAQVTYSGVGTVTVGVFKLSQP